MPVQAISPAHARPRPRPRGPRGEPLRFGYTADDVDRLARVAVGYDRSTRGMDASDRYEAAWSSVIERLYAAAEMPDESELIGAGLDRLRKLWADDIHSRGFNSHVGKTAGPASAPGYVRYWIGPAWGKEPEFVTTLVDTLAFRQVFALLTGAQRQALLALALYGDYEAAAAALGLAHGAFWSRLERAREVFLRWWHEHETPPSRPYAKDRRIARRELPRAVAAVLTEDEIPAVVVPDARAVFERLGADRLRTADLLACLKSARPGIYGRWDTTDLGAALRTCGIPPRWIQIDGRSCRGYRHDCLCNPGNPAADGDPAACDVILAAWLHQEQAADPAANPGAQPRAQMRRLVTEAGPDGITARELAGRLDGRAQLATIRTWLADDTETGILARLQQARYAAACHAPNAPPPPPPREPPDGHPHSDMLRWIREAGPQGIRTATLAQRLQGRAVRGTLMLWLNKDCARGTITRLRQGVYAASEAVA